MFCQYPSSNHSTDKVTVWYGSANPLHLCGYHSTWKLSNVLEAVRK